MKNTVKLIAILVISSIIFSSCSSDDKNPPDAGFSLSSTTAIQWDVVTISNAAIGADDVSYAVTGGEYKMEGNSIQFLEDAMYTVTQTATNGDGSNSASVTIDITEPDNKYVLDGTDLPLTSNAFYYEDPQNLKVYIRFLADVSGQDNPNLIKLYPVAGPNVLEGTYTYSDSGDIGTYDAGMTSNYAGFNFDWTTDGDGGQDLKIELVYEGDTTVENVYDITLTSYTLNYGNYNFATGELDSLGTKSFSITYRGVIDPIAG